MITRSPTTADAVRQVLTDRLARDPDLLVLGETAGRPGDLLAGAAEGRTLALPVADRGTLGLGLGAALAGKRVLVELADTGRLPAVAELLAEGGAVARRGEFPCALVVRVPYGVEAVGLDQPVGRWITELPGVTVVCGSTPGAIAALLGWALDQRGPVVVLEPRALAEERGAVEATRPPRVLVHREGSQATVAAWGAAVGPAVAAAEALSAEGLSVAVVELESLSPIDGAGLADVVRANGRLVVAHEGDPSLARAIRDAVAGEAFWWLEAPLVDGGPDHLAELVRSAVSS